MLQSAARVSGQHVRNGVSRKTAEYEFCWQATAVCETHGGRRCETRRYGFQHWFEPSAQALWNIDL